jgi:ADP-ribose pyrophosphatase YjhB (NUDIX family)
VVKRFAARDMVPVCDENNNVIGSTELGIAHIFGLHHQVALAVVVTPDGSILLDRRAHNIINQPKLLSGFGGHVKAGESYENTIRHELLEELFLGDIESSVKGRLALIGEPGQFLISNQKNQEFISVYAYFLTPDEYKHVLEVKARIDDIRAMGTMRDFESWIETEQQKRSGYGEGWGMAIVDINELKPKIRIREQYANGTLTEEVSLTKDIFGPLVENTVPLRPGTAKIDFVAELRKAVAGVMADADLAGKNPVIYNLDDEIDLRGDLSGTFTMFNFGTFFLAKYAASFSDDARTTLEYLKLLDRVMDSSRKDPEMARHVISFGGLGSWDDRIKAMSYYLYGETLTEEELVKRLDLNVEADRIMLENAGSVFNSIATLALERGVFQFRDLVREYRIQLRKLRDMFRTVNVISTDDLETGRDNISGPIDMSDLIKMDTDLDLDLLRRALNIYLGNIPDGKPAASAVSTVQDDLDVRAKVFQADLLEILRSSPEKVFVLAIDTSMGEAGKKEMMPIYKAIDRIREMKDRSGKSLFPNLMVKRAPGAELARELSGLRTDKNIELSQMFVVAKKANIDSAMFDTLKGASGAWITAVDDSNEGSYLPMFEAVILSMMAYLKADIAAVKDMYDSIADKPIDPAALEDMLKNRVIYLLPKAIRIDPNSLKKLYELAAQAYTSA